MWFNILGFIISIIFYCSVQFRVSDSPEIVRNPLQDSLFKIDFILTAEIQELKQQQNVLLDVLKKREERLLQQEEKISRVKDKINITIKSDWDGLPKSQKDRYAESLITKIKKQKP